MNPVEIMIDKLAEIDIYYNRTYYKDNYRKFFSNKYNLLLGVDGLVEILKEGSATTVSIIKRDGDGPDKDLVIKCFKSGGFIKTLARRFVGSKARKLFNSNSILFEKGLNVAEPVCFFDLFGSIESCFVSAKLGDCKNFALIFDDLIDKSPSSLAEAIAGEMVRWHSMFITHGDMKWSNIMIKINGDEIKPYFIDLDQAEFGSRVNLPGVMDDLTRFYRYGIERGRADWVYNVFLPAYMDSSAGLIKGGLNMEKIAIRAMAEHELKK